jgi:hypothetical protein
LSSQVRLPLKALEWLLLHLYDPSQQNYEEGLDVSTSTIKSYEHRPLVLLGAIEGQLQAYGEFEG